MNMNNLFNDLNYYLDVQMLNEKYIRWINIWEIIDNKRSEFRLNIFDFDFNEKKWIAQNDEMNSDLKNFLTFLNQNSEKHVDFYLNEIVFEDKVSEHIYNYVSTIGIVDYERIFLVDTNYSLLSFKQRLFEREDFQNYLYESKTKINEVSQDIDKMIHPFLYADLGNFQNNFGQWLTMKILDEYMKKSKENKKLSNNQ